MSEPSPLSKYASSGAMVYYGLVLPAVLLEVIFSVAVASTPGDLVTRAGSYGGVILAAAELLPLVVLSLSAWAVFTFRPSILVTLLVACFFLAVSVTNGITILAFSLDLGDAVVLVVAATFLALAGFSYARGIVLLGGRRADVKSSGPLGYSVLGVALDTAVPIVSALALVLVVEGVVAALNVQATHLPQPLSTLATLYLQTRIGVVFTTLFVAGAAIWVMRQFIEPVILHFTLSASDARRELLSEIEPTTKSVRKVARYRPSPGFAWAFLTIAYCLGIFAALAIFVPRAELYHDLVATIDLHPPAPSPLERLLESSFQSAIVWANIHYAQSQDYLRDIIRLLWG